jgi:N-methylhydantoinase A
VRLAEAEMEKAIRLVSVERGYDPREFTLIAFGGAGPLHACSLSRALGIPQVLVPAMPGALSALGIIGADVVRDHSRTVMVLVSANAADHRDFKRLSKDAKKSTSSDSNVLLDSLEAHFLELEAKGAREFHNEGLNGCAIRSADLRYAGQGYEINVPASSAMLQTFHEAHRTRYGQADESANVEVVNVRVRLIAASDPIETPRLAATEKDCSQAVIKEKKVMFADEWMPTPVFDRSLLTPRNCFAGPAIVHEYSATTVVPPGCRVQVDEYSNLVIQV